MTATRAVSAQLRTELTLSLRQGEQLLVSMGIPLGILIFFSKVNVFSTGGYRPIDLLAPGVLALAVMSTAMVSLGIGTGFERYYGVLKRLGSTPLGRPGLVGAKTGMVLVTEAGQFVVLISVAFALGWNPAGGWAEALAATLVGTAAFAGLGLFLAGTLPGPVNLAACNGLYLLLLITGGMMVPFDKLPAWLQHVAELLPAAALSDVMIGALTHGKHIHGESWIVLLFWGIALPAAAIWKFRWEP
jgi:ABC-2 type transport system permease protein